MGTGLLSNKAKTARRVIEILEYFDDHKRHATVMDIARRYGAPQSSTSELLAILVDMGLLYKDSASRCYAPTPRAAMLGSLFQPSPVRDGRLSVLMDSLVAQTGLGAALIGMVGLNIQVFRWIAGTTPLDMAVPGGVCSGYQIRAADSAAGWLLLSTIPAQRCEGMLRRMRAEAASGRGFNVAELAERVRACVRQGFAVGPSGLGPSADMCAVLLPREPDERPMALAFVYQQGGAIDPKSLVAILRDAAQSCVSRPAGFVDLRVREAANVA